jgi:hypothetical protein
MLYRMGTFQKFCFFLMYCKSIIFQCFSFLFEFSILFFFYSTLSTRLPPELVRTVDTCGALGRRTRQIYYLSLSSLVFFICKYNPLLLWLSATKKIIHLFLKITFAKCALHIFSASQSHLIQVRQNILKAWSNC